MVTAIAAYTGKFVEVRIYSKFCWFKNRLKEKYEYSCVANRTGVDMFNQSPGTHSVTCKYYFGDGDSASYPGTECLFEKLECLELVKIKEWLVLMRQ